MSKFQVPMRIDLSFLGEGWKDCFLLFNAFSVNDVLFKLAGRNLSAPGDAKVMKDSAGEILDLLKEKFIEGKGYDGKKIVEIVKEDIGDLPVQVIPKITELLGGVVSPNAGQPSQI